VGRRIYAIDVGSTRCDRGKPSNFAWARLDPAHPKTLTGSSDIELLAERLIHDLVARHSVALGFEAPLFVPVPSLAANLCRGRANEGSRSFAAPAGLAVASLGIHQSAWVLRRVFEATGTFVRFSQDPSAWPPSGDDTILFCWRHLCQRAHILLLTSVTRRRRRSSFSQASQT
jgi:hypothetical protein